MRSSVRIFLVAWLLILLSGCERYAQMPLQADSILASVERKRHLLGAELLDPSTTPVKAEAVAFTFVRVVALMKDNSPALKELRAEYDTAQALANVKTPLPNPSFEAGPQYGFGPKVSPLYRLQPMGSLGFTNCR